MGVLTEPKYAGEFIATEANGQRSRDNATLITGQAAVLGVGRLLGKITASGNYTDLSAAVLAAAGDGSAVAAGILFAATDATTASKTCVVLVRSCEVNRSELDFGALNTGQQTTAIAQLAAIGVIVRPAV